MARENPKQPPRVRTLCALLEGLTLLIYSDNFYPELACTELVEVSKGDTSTPCSAGQGVVHIQPKSGIGYFYIIICDFQKWDSPVVKAYHVFATPTMYLLDSNQKILLRPNSVRQMDAWVDWFLVQGNRRN